MNTQKAFHMVNRTKMFWQPKNKRSIQLKYIEDDHLNKIETIIKNKPVSSNFNGFSQQAWLTAIRLEKEYRKQLVNSILDKVVRKDYSKRKFLVI